MKTRSLSKRVEREVFPNDSGAREIDISRKGILPPSEGLRSGTRALIDEFRNRLGFAIPDDFDFMLRLGEGRVSGFLIYQDGPMAECVLEYNFAKPNVVEALRKLPWDEYREQALDGTNLHDEVLKVADRLPILIPSVAEIRSAHAATVAEFEGESKQVTEHYSFLAFCEETGGTGYVQGVSDDRKDFVVTIGDYLTHDFHLLAIVENQKAASPDKVESIRQEALADLPPISKSKAEGRFQVALTQMGAIQ